METSGVNKVIRQGEEGRGILKGKTNQVSGKIEKGKSK